MFVGTEESEEKPFIRIEVFIKCPSECLYGTNAFHEYKRGRERGKPQDTRRDRKKARLMVTSRGNPSYWERKRIRGALSRQTGFLSIKDRACWHLLFGTNSINRPTRRKTEKIARAERDSINALLQIRFPRFWQREIASFLRKYLLGGSICLFCLGSLKLPVSILTRST